jgi:predicted metalloprotease with PDZ domain
MPATFCWSRSKVLGLLLVLCAATAVHAQSPVLYRISFPEPEHHWMLVEARFEQVPEGSLAIHISRSSPGRYALHEFAKNVYDVHIDDGAGNPLRVEKPNNSEWDVSGHAGVVRMRYRVFGDQVDGTYLAVDTTHAHINVPAALVWARGLEARAVRVSFEVPRDSAWKIATQLHATEDPTTFTAANLQYLVDSPVELSNFVSRTFEVNQRRFRIALHHDGSDRDADRLADDVERIVREAAAIFGELPAYEGGSYTFIADCLPYASSDGMEHRNSTVITAEGALRVAADRQWIIGTVAHEFFHSWNVERIRPRSLEPFDLDQANVSGELWFAEGFTSYYQSLIIQRTGLASIRETAATWGYDVDTVMRDPGRRYRSAEDMSRMAPYVDAAAWSDHVNFANTYISYYTWGAAIALALDLSLRERGLASLDDYMRALWRDFGKREGIEGAVARPYTMADLRDRLAEVSGDRAFADGFFDRFIQGREVADYRTLLEHAGLLLRSRNTGRAWIGQMTLEFDHGLARISSPLLENTPAYRAGLDEDDEVASIDGEPVTGQDRLDEIIRRYRPGAPVRFVIRRRGVQQEISVPTEEDPRLEIVPLETERQLTDAERQMRDAWLGSKR